MNESTADGETPLNLGNEGRADAPGVSEDICQACRGKGTVEGARCVLCGGTGKTLQGIGGWLTPRMR